MHHIAVSTAQTSLELTSEPSSSARPFCPGHVQFTCTGTELPVVLRWVLNDTIIATFTFQPTLTYPFPLDPTTSFPPGVVINVTSAANNVNSINITTILDVSDVSVLNRSSLYCEDSANISRSNVINIEVGRGEHSIVLLAGQSRGGREGWVLRL